MAEDGYVHYREDVAPREGGFFGALTRKQSYLNIAYLLLSFPLSIFYFVFLVTGYALGFGLLVIGIGFLILLFMIVATRGLASWERQLAVLLLGARIPPPDPNPAVWSHPWIAFKRCLTDSYTWKSLLYFLIKFPLAVFAFVVTVFFGSFTLALILTPLLYRFAPIHFFFWRVMHAEEALLCAAIGIVMGVVAIHVMNGLGALSRGLAAGLLSGSVTRRAEVKSGPVIIP